VHLAHRTPGRGTSSVVADPVVISPLKLSPSDGRLSQTAQQAIRAYIEQNRLRGGDPLPPEGRLAQELGVSRASVREAVKGLESLGILEARPGVGIFVRSFSFDPILDNLAYGVGADGNSVAELLYVRKQLEAGAIEDVAAGVTPAQLRVLRSIVDRMGERAAQGQSFPEEDRFFHRTLFTGLERPLLLKLLDVFWEVYRRLRDGTPLAETVDPVRSWESHRRIVEALESGDGAVARAAVLTHFAGLEARLQDTRWRTGDGGPAGTSTAAGAGEHTGPGSTEATRIVEASRGRV
jgi:DNA-binding FadR family transcriptional regulator